MLYQLCLIRGLFLEEFIMSSSKVMQVIVMWFLRRIFQVRIFQGGVGCWSEKMHH